MSTTNDNTMAQPHQRRPSLPEVLSALVERCDRWSVRAILRASVSFPVGALVGSVSELLSDAKTDYALDWAFAGASAASIVAMLLWFARRDGGIRAAIKLSLVSWGFFQSLVAAVQTLWMAAGMAGPPDWGFVCFSAAVSIALFVPTAVVLCRLDPDY